MLESPSVCVSSTLVHVVSSPPPSFSCDEALSIFEGFERYFSFNLFSPLVNVGVAFKRRAAAEPVFARRVFTPSWVGVCETLSPNPNSTLLRHVSQHGDILRKRSRVVFSAKRSGCFRRWFVSGCR